MFACRTCKSLELGTDLYTNDRFIALTGTGAVGRADTDFSAILPQFVERYFPVKSGSAPNDWTTTPVPEWNGPTDDDELIRKALAAQSGAGIFGGRSTFATLWAGDAEDLAHSYPDDHGGRAYDASADGTGAAFSILTGRTASGCGRYVQVRISRDKYNWGYLIRTIQRLGPMQRLQPCWWPADRHSLIKPR